MAGPKILLLLCIRYRGNVSTEPLPSNDKGIFTEPLSSNDKGTFTKPLSSNDKGTFTEPLPSNGRGIHKHSNVILYAYFYFFQNKESRLNYSIFQNRKVG
jgi:hypothetical protein